MRSDRRCSRSGWVRSRIIAETGAGQHGVASAAAAARLGLPCVVYMGAVDVERQAPNVGRMQLLGATVVPVTTGDRTLRAAIDEALRDWVSDPDGTYYCLGSAVGPHPYPYLVRELQSVIGREARAQMLALAGGLPDVAVACVGGGSNAIGLFHPFLDDAEVELLGVEAGGRGPGLGDNAASLTFGTPGVLQGSYTLILQDAFGQVRETHSVSAGLDYSGVGPEHAYLKECGRAIYESATDEEALDALAECARCEGILPAIETAHAIFGARRYARAHPGSRILIGCSGRGDKDMSILQRTLLKPPCTAHDRISDRDRRRGRAGPPGAGRVSDGRISDARGFQGQPGRGRTRLRRGGDRRAVLRSDGRRLHHSACEFRGARQTA